MESRNNENSNNNQSTEQQTIKRNTQPVNAYLLQLPPEALARISQYFVPREQYALSRLSLYLNLFFKKPASLFVKQFLTHVVCGEKNKVREMIKRDPHLLLEEAMVIDEAGRKVYGTAYRIALGAKAVSGGKHKEMVEMIECELEKLHGKKELDKQYAEQFPEGWEKQEEERMKNDSEALINVFAALKEAETKEDREKAVEKFQDYLNKQTKSVIKTGYHFNENLFVEAYELYKSHFEEFGGFDNPKNKLILIKVIGGIERYFTACLADAACNDFDENRPLLGNKLLEDKTSFFSSELGVSYFVYNYTAYKERHCGAQGWWGLYPATLASFVDGFCNLCRVKTVSLVSRQNPTPESSQKSCTIQ